MVLLQNAKRWTGHQVLLGKNYYIPENTLTQSAIAEIVQISDDEELINFTARNFEKEVREGYIIIGRESKITGHGLCF